ncbi:Cytochrome P450 [Halogranum amylolyticum]|uniref:Cytochrome P450 n=1 Tax=Halogranum amylolyticum TaxID=660520 RepID=A0A1H8RV05_9EURY|nr:cytochrome P450 [Halogranum amylolyticum]SEO70192.1 Cytochrome P450 [Halogranum amylolyticum]
MSSQETVDDGQLPPGPDGVPLVGNTVEFVRDVFGFYDTLAEYGDVVSYRVGGHDFVTLLHPDQIEQVLVDDADSYEKGDILRQSGVDFLEHGVLLTEGEEWRRQRTAMQPTFYRERVETYGETMAAYAAATVDSWDDGQVVDLTDEFSALALSILATTLFGVDIRGDESAIRDAAHAVQERSDAGSIQSFLPEWLPTPRNRRFRRATDEFDRVVRDLIAERRRATEASDDLLSLLLDVTYEDGTAMDERTVRDQLMTFLFAGHETTSLALSYAVFALARHPEVAARLRAEIDDVVGDGRPTAADVRRLDDTERVLKETLRLYPPAYVLFRQPTRDVVLGGYRVPEGTQLTLPSFRLHADPRWYDDPESFRPERWTDEMEAELPDYAYFPFGGGPRHCIGMRFAILELHLVLATLVQSCEFDLVSDPDLEFTAAATLQPKEALRVRVRKR